MPATTATPAQAVAPCAIVTGAASGLGRAIAIALARRGWQLALCDLDLAGCQTTAQRVDDAGGKASVHSLDVTSADQWSLLIARLQADWPTLDLLVNNAGVAAAGEVGDFSLADWHWVLDVNLWGAIHGCHVCRDWLVANPRGAHVVNIASAAAIVCGPTMGAYNVSKAGVVALSETLYAELRPRGVGVTVVCPGFFRSNLLNAARFQEDRFRVSAEQFMNRARVSSDEVALAILHAVDRRRLYLVLPLRARIFWLLRRICPAGMMRLVAWIASRENHGRPQTATTDASTSD